MERILIEDRISYWKGTEQPLSSDIGYIRGNQYVWLYDVGSSKTAAEAIQRMAEPKKVILSHFHQDHITNWNQIICDTIYQGAYTKRYTQTGEVVQGHIYLEDGVKLHLFELPCSHAKGTVALEVNDTYAFLGDAVYCMVKNGQRVYNANLLAEEIRILQELKAEYFLLSHDRKFVRPKKAVLKQLEAIYLRRDRKNAYIHV